MAPANATGKLGVIFTADGFYLDVVEGELCEEALRVQDAFEQDRYRALYHLGFSSAATWFYPSLYFLHAACEAFLRALTRIPELELVRGNVSVELDQDEAERLLRQRPFGLGAEHVDIEWLQALFVRFNAIFSDEIAAWSGTVEMYLTEKTQQLRVPERIFFHLVENRNDEEFPFAFMATYATYTADDTKKIVRHMPLKYALTEYRNNKKKLLELLSCLGRASAKSTLISDFVESGELFSALHFTADEAYIFLREIPLYEDAGIFCRIPNWYKKNNAKVQLGITVGEKGPSRLSFDVLIALRPNLTVDGVELTRGEVADLLAQTEGLALLKGKWVEIDHEHLQALLDDYDKANGKSITLLEALRGTESLAASDEDGQDWGMSNGEWLRLLRDKMQHPSLVEPPTLPATFTATLRPYQVSGFGWLNYMNTLGFGACLADDMGLGKTVQVLAFLEYVRNGTTDVTGGITGGIKTTTKPSSKNNLACISATGVDSLNNASSNSEVGSTSPHALLVVPASLLGNWQQEIGRFAPKMPFQILHGRPGKTLEQEFDPDAFLVITSYAMAAKLACIKNRIWDVLILDEAQAIKNPGAKQTRAIKEIPARNRIAMTGTPIENDLGNLWSLFDFLNSGLLGTRREFSDFSKSLTMQPTGYSRLRDMVNPFILRRLKTDKSIVDDLPDKNEIEMRVTLSKKQVVLYRKVTADLARTVEEVSGIARTGLVLSTIMKLKQICNHPSQYLGDGVFEKQDSGKYALLEELCATIYAKRERVLVFTQFKEMCGPLDDFLSEIFGRRGLIIHGSISPKKRTELVARFQKEETYVPYMILSLKAGGTGLNLTAANHVIHFDRWWNPAVENQATDRAFRIGQKKDVMVYKLMSGDTVEERIAQIISDKSKLANDIIGGSGESWITKLSDSELLNLLRLE